MEAKEEYLWEEVKELALTKFCCESPRLYRIFQNGVYRLSKKYFNRDRMEKLFSMSRSFS